MTSDDRFGGTVSVWLQQRAGTGAPDYLDDILGRTARTRQRPGWTSIERWPPMDISASRTAFPSRFPVRSLALLVILGLVLVAVVAAIVAVGSRPRLPEPFGPARNGALVYAADGDIYRLESRRRRAVAHPRRTNRRSRSDASREMARSSCSGAQPRRSSNRLGVASADGSDPRIVTGDLDGVSAIDWSPDGSQFAVVHTLLGLGVVSIVDATGKEPIQRLDLGDIHPVDWVAWRPEAGGIALLQGRAAGGLERDDDLRCRAGRQRRSCDHLAPSIQ